MSWGVIFLVFLGICYLCGNDRTFSHYEQLEKDEKELLHIPVSSLKIDADSTEIEELKLVTASVVISIDLFKRLYAYLRNFFGGSVDVYASVIHRAQREAVVRMKKQSEGFHEIVDMNFTSVFIKRDSHRGIGCSAVTAYGTAVKYKHENIV